MRTYTEAKKEGNRKWDAANLDRISLAVPKGKKETIQAHAAARGESVNGFIGRVIDEAIERDTGGGPVAAPSGSVPPDKVGEVKAHIDVIGEDEASFMGRAVDEQMRRDKISLRMGINPATGKKITLEGGAQHE